MVNTLGTQTSRTCVPCTRDGSLDPQVQRNGQGFSFKLRSAEDHRPTGAMRRVLAGEKKPQQATEIIFTAQIIPREPQFISFETEGDRAEGAAPAPAPVSAPAARNSGWSKLIAIAAIITGVALIALGIYSANPVAAKFGAETLQYAGAATFCLGLGTYLVGRYKA